MGEAGFSGDIAPKFEATVKFGHDFQEMFNNLDGSVATLSGGFSAHLKTTLAKALIESVGEASNSDKEQVEALAAIAELTYEGAIEYGKEQLADAVPMNFTEELNMFHRKIATAPYVVMAPIKPLKDLSDGLTGVQLRGLPHNYEVVVELTDVKVTPVIANV